MVDELAQNMSINPVSSTSMTQQVDEALAVFGRLSAEDYVVSLLRQGESKTVEFKQTLSLDIADNTKKRFLEDMVIKTVGAFLNSDGGDLLVGVNDEGQVIGIGLEIEKLHKGSKDNFLKHFKNCLKTRIGEQSYPRVRYDIIDVAEKSVFRVTCQPSDIAVFVDGDAFYVRTNPATDKIVGQVFLDYVEQRFKRNSPAVLG
jgi:predicted HTH transcriptional regulator